MSETDSKMLETPKQKFSTAISKNMMQVEREFGYTDFDWPFAIVSFKGEVWGPEKFTPFDKAVCELLLMNNFGLKELGYVLGFGYENEEKKFSLDIAEEYLLKKEIDDLRVGHMIEVKGNACQLTRVGREYAENGEKIKTQKDVPFEVYIDLLCSLNDTGKKIFSALKSEELKEFCVKLFDEKAFENGFSEEISYGQTEQNEVLSFIRTLAEHQTAKVHFPKKRFRLVKCRPTKERHFSAKLKVVLLENFRDETNRVLVYDEKSEKVIEPLSEAFSENKEQMKRIFEKILAESAESESPLESTDEEKSDEQIEYEQAQIEKQEELDQAIDSGDQNQLEKIVNQELENRNSSEKRLFYTLEFEAEFERLLTGPYDEIMILTPWIKNATLKRISLYESFLKRGKKLFIAYSAPERPDDIMCYEKPFSELQKLEAKYPQFYLCQREQPFHFKQVWCKGFFLYNGSENISSFMPKGSDEVKVRDECMTKLSWASDLENDYNGKLASFGLRYLAEAEQKFDELCGHENISLDRNFLKEVAAFKIDKLEFFVDKTIEEFDAEYDRWRSFKENKTADFRKKFCEQELLKIQADLEAEAPKSVNQVVSIKKLNELEKRLGAFCKEFPESETLAQKSSIEKSLSEYRERFYKNQLENFRERINTEKAVFRNEVVNKYRKELKALVDKNSEIAKWKYYEEIEKLLETRCRQACEQQISEILDEEKNSAAKDLELWNLNDLRKKLGNISKDFPNVKSPIQVECENLLKAMFCRYYEKELHEILDEVKLFGKQLISTEKLKDSRISLARIPKDQLNESGLKVLAEIESLLTNAELENNVNTNNRKIQKKKKKKRR